MQGSIGGKNIYGQVNNPVTTVEYKGGSTDTADVSIDSKKKEITADVKKLPNDLIVEDRTGEEVKEIRFNGDGERSVVLKDWTLKEVDPKTSSNVLEYSLIKDGKETGDRIISPKLERCLYKSETNASKWESKEGSFTGYLGTSDEETLKASVGLQLKAANVFMPTYPVVSGTYYSPMDNSNTLTGELNLTPFNGASSPLLSFSGTSSLSMGSRSIYLDSGWFNANTSNISLKIPAVSGTLVTEADALGSIDIEVDDLDTTSVLLTDAQFNALCKYPKALMAFKLEYGDNYRYFTKLEDLYSGSAGVKYITAIKSDNGLKVGIATSSFNYDKVSYQLDIVYTELADVSTIFKITTINYGFYPTVDSDNNITVKSYNGLTETEIEELKKLAGSYVITSDGYPAFVKLTDDNTILIEDLGVCAAGLNRTLPHNKRSERIALELTTVEKSLLGKVTQSDNYKLEQTTADLQTSLSNEITTRDAADRELQQNIDTEQARAQSEENDIRANLSEEIANRKSDVLELQEECSNITQGIQEFSNSVDIRFQEKEEEITKNFDSISALSDKEASDVSGLQASIDQEVSDRKTAVSDLKKSTVAILQDYSEAGSEITPYAWSYYAGCGWVIDQGSTYNKFTIEANEIYTAVYIITNDNTHITLPDAFSGNHIVAYQENIDALKNDSITPLEERVSVIEEKFESGSLAALNFYFDDLEPK